MRVFLRLAAVVALLGLVPLPASADPAPPKAETVDIEAATAALEHQQILVLPGSAARIDLDAVRKAMTPTTRLLVMPYVPKEIDGDQHYREVYVPLTEWAEQRHFDLIYVEGVQASNSHVTAGPSTLGELREHTAYHEITGPVLGLIEYNKAQDRNAPIPYPKYQVTAPTPAQLDDLTAKLRASPIYNAPGVEHPVTLTPDQFATARKAFGHDLRIAALPLLTPGDPFVDYAPALAKRFPDSVVLVAQGDWMEIKGPDQQLLVSARDAAYGKYQNSTFTRGLQLDNRIASIATRVYELSQKKPFGRPQPAAQPKPVPYDVRRTISAAAPWALLGSAIALTGSGLLYRRLRTARADADEKQAMRREKARAFARIGDLGAKILAAEEAGEPVPASVGERHATASALYDQALTSVAMREVTKVADEGLRLLVEGATR